MERSVYSSLKNSYHPRTSAFVRYCPLVARVLGSANAALLFQRLQDLEAMYTSKDRAFFRTNADLMADLCLGRYELQSARKVLEEHGIYTVFQKPNDQKNWFRVNYDACDAVLRECNRIAHEEDARAGTPVIHAPEVADTPLLETRPPLLETSNTPPENQQQRRKREEREEERGEISTQPRRFVAPSEEDARGYAQELGMPASEGSAFIDHHTSKGWIIGKSPMKDWKAAMRTWNRRYTERRKTQPPGSVRPPSRQDGGLDAWKSAPIGLLGEDL